MSEVGRIDEDEHAQISRTARDAAAFFQAVRRVAALGLAEHKVLCVVGGGVSDT